jgi:hypothetical protein
MTDPEPPIPTEDPNQDLEAEVQQAIELCGGDLMAALHTTLVANTFLEAEVKRLRAAVSTGYSRGRIRHRPAGTA